MINRAFLIISIFCLQACSYTEAQQLSDKQKPEFTQANSDTVIDIQEEAEIIKTFESGHFYTQEDLEFLSFAWDSSTPAELFNRGWTNGLQWFSLDTSEVFDCVFGSGTRPYVHLSGGDRHEGGLSLLGVLQNDTTIRVLSSYINEIKKDDVLRAYIYDGINCIVVLKPDGTFKTVVVDANIDLGNDEDICVQKNLAGRWGDPHFGNEIEFFNNGRRVVWNGEEKQFYFESGEYDQLLNIFTIKDNSYYFERDGERLVLYKIDKEKDEWGYSGFEPESFDTEYFLQEKSRELTFEEFKRNVKSQFQ